MRVRNNSERIRIAGYIIESGINVLPSDFLEALRRNEADSRRWETLKNNKVIEII